MMEGAGQVAIQYSLRWSEDRTTCPGQLAGNSSWVTLPTPGWPGLSSGLPTPPMSPVPSEVTLPAEAILIAVAGLESQAKNVTQQLVGEEEAARPAGVGAE